MSCFEVHASKLSERGQSLSYVLKNEDWNGGVLDLEVMPRIKAKGLSFFH